MAEEKRVSGGSPLGEGRVHINIVAVVLSVLAAVALWIYVLAVDSPTNEKTFSGVAIKLNGVDTLSNTYGFSVLSGYDLTADVTLRGKRSELNRLNADDLSATVSLSDIKEAGSYPKQVTVSIPSGMDVVSVSPSFITVDIDVEKTVTVPVLEPKETYTLSENVMLRREYSAETISVKGPQEVLDRIVGVEPEVELGALTENVSKTVPVRFVDASGNEITNRYLTSQGTISIAYTLYKEKTVPLVLQIETLLEGESVEQSVTPQKITVQGPPQKIDELTEIYAKTVSTADMKSLTNTYTGTVELPDGFDSPSGAVTYSATTALKGVAETSLSLSISGSNVRVIGLPDGYRYAFSADTISVTLRALADSIDAIDASALNATVNLSSFSEEGTYDVDVSFTVASDKRNLCYVVGTQNLGVTLTKA